MAILNSDNQIGILIKSDADLKGLNEATRSVGDLEKQAGGGSKAAMLLGTAGKAAAVGIAAAGVATAALGAQAISSAGSYEQSRIAFETMLGSADKARGLMQDIANFAKTTPFELPEVVAGSKQLLAFGFSQEQLLPTMKKLGDLASGLGVPIGQLTNVFGQVKVAGRLMGQDLLQFTNAGVPMIEALATTMKKPQSEIKKLVEQGKIGFPEVETALNSLTGEGSKFGGMMDKQSKTFNGVVSNIKDGFGQVLRGAVGVTPAGDIVAGGVFDRIKNAAQAAMPLVQKAAENAGPAVMNAFKKIGEYVTIAKDALKSLWDIVGPILMPSLKALADTFMNDLFPPLKRLWDIIGPQLIPMLKILGTILGVVIVANIWIFVNVANVLYKAIGWLINIFIEIGQRVEWVGKIIAQAAQYVYNSWVNGINGILSVGRSLISWFGGVGQSIGNALSSVYGYITSPFARAWDFVSGIPSKIVGAIGNVGNLLRAKLGDWDIPGPLGKVRDVIPGWASGGYTGAGGANEVAGLVHKGEYVIPKSGVDQSTGLPKSVGGNRTTTIQNVWLGSAAAAKEFFHQMDNDQLLESRNFAPVRGGM